MDKEVKLIKGGGSPRWILFDDIDENKRNDIGLDTSYVRATKKGYKLVEKKEVVLESLPKNIFYVKDNVLLESENGSYILMKKEDEQEQVNVKETKKTRAVRKQKTEVEKNG